jgi:hypothetical protein
MHPWTLERLAEERRCELARAAARARAAHHARGAGSGGPLVANRRATRYFGELLIRTGWRLVGPDVPGTGVRSRLALRASGGAMVDPC